MGRQVAFAMLLAAAIACDRQEPTPNEPTARWQVVATWSGRGSQQLDTFQIDRQTWRIRWETKNESPAGAGIFYLTANSGDSGRVLAEVVEATGVDHDVAYISELPRRYYLVVTSSAVDWTITAEEPVFE